MHVQVFIVVKEVAAHFEPFDFAIVAAAGYRISYWVITPTRSVPICGQIMVLLL